MANRRTRVLIMGAAGRDFHNFNTYFRDREEYEVVAFTATQIPYIDDRKYPAELAGKLYPDGIPIVDQADLVDLIWEEQIDAAIFAYSDISHVDLMHIASTCIAAGANFELLSAEQTMLDSSSKD